MGVDAFKWTALVVGVTFFVYGLVRGEGVLGSLIAGGIIGAIAGGLVSMGKDKLSGP